MVVALGTGCSGLIGSIEEGSDAAVPLEDAGVSAQPDSGISSPEDAGPDASVPDASVADASVADASVADAGPPRVSVYIVGLNPSGYGRSLDGKTWTDLQPLDRKDAGVVAGDNAVTAIAFGLGLVIAVGDSGISVSRDGRTWDNVMPTRLHSAVAAFAFGKFFVLSGGDVWSSADGTHWAVTTGTGDATHWHSLTLGRVGGVEMLLAVGDQWEFVTGTNPVAPHRLKKSSDGVTWDYFAAHRDTPIGDEQIDSAVIGNDFALGVSAKHPGAVYRFDGSNFQSWQKLSLPSDGGTPMNLSASCFANGQFVFAGTGPYSYNTGATTTDAQAWNVYPTQKSATSAVPVDFVPFPVYGRMQWTGSRFIGPFPFHVEARLGWSTDGVTWNAEWAPTPAQKVVGDVSVIAFGEVSP